jgi:hypothetical protein
MKKILFIILLIANSLVFAANERIALVIGNSTYSELGTLSNTINDAKNINKSLLGMGYKTTLVLNANEATLRKEIKLFAGESENSNIALVFYAGHGAQVNGENYLLPIDINVPKRESDIQLSSVKVDDIINTMKSKTKVIFLDACRDNPALIKSLSKGRGSYQGGLAPAGSSLITDQSSGIFIAYSTDAGNIALDGAGQLNSPFTGALLKYIQEPISIDDMFSMVTKEVRKETKNSQKPYKYASLDGIVCLPGTCSKVPSFSDQIGYEKSTPRTKANNIGLPNWWVLFNSQLNPNKLSFVEPGSLKKIDDRVSISWKWVDDSSGGLPFGNSGSKYVIYGVVADCKTYKANIFSAKGFDGDAQIFDQRYGSPETINLSADYSSKGVIGYAMLQLACNPSRMEPLVSPEEMNQDSWERFYSLQEGVDVSILKGSIKAGNVNEVITKMSFKGTELSKLKEYLNITTGYENYSNTPKVSHLVSKTKFYCSEKISRQTLENYLGDDNKVLVYTSYQDQPLDEIMKSPKIITDSVFDQLSTLACKK